MSDLLDEAVRRVIDREPWARRDAEIYLGLAPQFVMGGVVGPARNIFSTILAEYRYLQNLYDAADRIRVMWDRRGDRIVRDGDTGEILAIHTRGNRDHTA